MYTKVSFFLKEECPLLECLLSEGSSLLYLATSAESYLVATLRVGHRDFIFSSLTFSGDLKGPCNLTRGGRNPSVAFSLVSSSLLLVKCEGSEVTDLL